MAVEWCDAGSSYNELIGLCVQTVSPSASPITTSPTNSVLETAAPMLASQSPTTQPTLSSKPSLDLELVVVVPDTIPVNNVTDLVEVEDYGAANLYSMAPITLTILLLANGLTLCS